MPFLWKWWPRPSSNYLTKFLGNSRNLPVDSKVLVLRRSAISGIVDQHSKRLKNSTKIIASNVIDTKNVIKRHEMISLDVNTVKFKVAAENRHRTTNRFNSDIGNLAKTKESEKLAKFRGSKKKCCGKESHKKIKIKWNSDKNFNVSIRMKVEFAPFRIANVMAIHKNVEPFVQWDWVRFWVDSHLSDGGRWQMASTELWGSFEAISQLRSNRAAKRVLTNIAHQKYEN